MTRFRRRYESEIGTENDFVKFSQGTDPELAGWWYHATDEEMARELSDRTRSFESNSSKLKDKISFTRAPKGAAKNYANYQTDRWVVRTVIKANPRNRLVDLADISLTNGVLWAHVWDVLCIMVERGSFRERIDENEDAGESGQDANATPLLMPDSRTITRNF